MKDIASEVAEWLRGAAAEVADAERAEALMLAQPAADPTDTGGLLTWPFR